MSNSSNTFLGILAGTAIGATLGILFAPDKGSATRQRIANEARYAKDSIMETAIDLKDRAASSLTANKESLESRLESVISDVSYKTEDVISQLEEKLKVLKARNRKLQKS